MDTRYYTRQTQKNLISHQNENIMDTKAQNAGKLAFLSTQTTSSNTATLGDNKLTSLMVQKTALSVHGLTLTNTSALSLNGNRNALGDVGNKLQLNTLAAAPLVLKKSVQQQAIKKDFILLQPQQNLTHERMDISETSDDNDDCQIVDEVHMKSTHVIDIDENDHDNPQLVSCYVKDIYKYLMSMERKFRIASTFMDNKICNTRMRAVLIDWLIQVHLKFHLLQETMYLCVNIIDLYLQTENVVKSQLQLLGVAALFLAAKYEEMYIPSIEDFVYMTDNTYSKSDIRRMEIQILKTLNFILAKPISLNFLRRFSKAGQIIGVFLTKDFYEEWKMFQNSKMGFKEHGVVQHSFFGLVSSKADPKQHTLSKFLLELCLHDSDFASMDPSYQAASALCLSFKLLNGTEWNDTLEYYSTYTETQLQYGMKKYAQLVLKSHEPEYKYKAVSNKYTSSKYLRITYLAELRGSLIRQISDLECSIYQASS